MYGLATEPVTSSGILIRIGCLRIVGGGPLDSRGLLIGTNLASEQSPYYSMGCR